MSGADIEKMLETAGDFGRYQVFLMVLFSFVNVASAFHYFSQTFISITPDHWCNSSELWKSGDDDVLTIAKRSTFGLNDQSCTKYDSIDSFNSSDKTVLKCDNGWIYDRDSGFESIVSELNWVCDDNWKPVIGQSTFFIGSVLGTMILGVLSDRIGRLPILCIANFLALMGNISTIFSTSLPTFATFRFISGLATDNNFVMMYLIVMEYVRPSMRTIGLNLCIGVFYCFGCAVVPLIAIALGTWRRFLLITSLPLGIVVCYYFILFLVVAVLASPILCQHNYYQGLGQQGHYQHEPEHYEPPKYEYTYKVEDEHTRDYKEQHEVRDGDITKGYYWLLDADGHRRHVEYSVEGKSGFQVHITREPTGHPPVPPQAPVHHAPAHLKVLVPAPIHH